MNLEGKFDYEYPTGPKGAGWIGGRSNTPNIFLTDTSPEFMKIQDFGSNQDKQYAFMITIEDIISQDLRIYPNPSKEYPNIYNIPCITEMTELKINPEKIIRL